MHSLVASPDRAANLLEVAVAAAVAAKGIIFIFKLNHKILLVLRFIILIHIRVHYNLPLAAVAVVGVVVVGFWQLASLQLHSVS